MDTLRDKNELEKIYKKREPTLARRLKILLTGSNGFLGSYFVNSIKNDDFEIYKFLRSDINLSFRFLSRERRNKFLAKTSQV